MSVAAANPHPFYVEHLNRVNGGTILKLENAQNIDT